MTDAAQESAQALIDALSAALRRPVLLDDAALTPIAHSRQWGAIDAVRSESILSRGPSAAVRRALERQGIARATDVMPVAAEPALGMRARLCVPLRRGPTLLGYVWLLESAEPLTAAELERVRAVAARIAELLARAARGPVADERALLAALRSPDGPQRAEAAARAGALLAAGPLAVCLLAPRAAGVEAFAAAGAAARRLSRGHALAATAPEGAALLVALADPVLAAVAADGVAEWVRAAAGADVAVGQSDAVAGLDGVAAGARRAAVALRAAAARSDGEAHAAWSALGADRLVAQLPPAADDDLPAGLARLLREQPALTATLAAFLDAAGDVKATATALSLHRSGLYYRLRRVEELTGLDLDDGDDRLLAHLAIRRARLRDGARHPS